MQVKFDPSKAEFSENSIEMSSIELVVANKSKIFIFEDEVFSQIALENILFEQLKLFNYTSFYNSGASILRAIRDMYYENEMNIVALVIIDYKMRDMNGITLIEQARIFLRSMDVPPNEMPVFAFKDQQFWDLPLDITQRAFSLGVQTHHLIKKITNVRQMKKYFKKIGYNYKQFGTQQG